MNVAFKEWAVVVDALSRGRQTLILRKGGIHEGRFGFRPNYETFLLYPTHFHEQSASVTEPAAERFKELSEGRADPTSAAVTHFARVERWLQVEDRERARRLKGTHIWSERVIDQRFDWGGERGVFAIIVRVHALRSPKTIERLPRYGGCRSWISLETEFDLGGAIPVLDDAAFAARQKRILDALARP